MNVGTLSIEEFKKVAGENGVENVTDEEYVDHAQDKPWSLKTALTRVRKGRDGIELPDRAVEMLGAVGEPIPRRDCSSCKYAGVHREHPPCRECWVIGGVMPKGFLDNWEPRPDGEGVGV